MLIQSLIFTQDSDSKYISDITVTLKEIRVAETKTVAFDQNIFPPPVKVQSAPEENQGKTGSKKENVSLLYSVVHGGK